jgi:hypothetical protein
MTQYTENAEAGSPVRNKFNTSKYGREEENVCVCLCVKVLSCLLLPHICEDTALKVPFL